MLFNIYVSQAQFVSLCEGLWACYNSKLIGCIDRIPLFFGTKAQTIYLAASAIQSSSDVTAQVQSQYAALLEKFDDQQEKDTGWNQRERSKTLNVQNHWFRDVAVFRNVPISAPIRVGGGPSNRKRGKTKAGKLQGVIRMLYSPGSTRCRSQVQIKSLGGCLTSPCFPLKVSLSWTHSFISYWAATDNSQRVVGWLLTSTFFCFEHVWKTGNACASASKREPLPLCYTCVRIRMRLFFCMWKTARFQGMDEKEEIHFTRMTV